MPAPSAICGRKRCTETEAQEQAAAARAAVADLAFVSREEVVRYLSSDICVELSYTGNIAQQSLLCSCIVAIS